MYILSRDMETMWNNPNGTSGDENYNVYCEKYTGCVQRQVKKKTQKTSKPKIEDMIQKEQTQKNETLGDTYTQLHAADGGMAPPPQKKFEETMADNFPNLMNYICKSTDPKWSANSKQRHRKKIPAIHMTTIIL